MAQFTKYKNSDSGAPQLSGEVGKLITILDYCLVTGQSWTHPVATAANCASYAPAAGSGGILHLNDNGPNGVALAKEYRLTGWVTLSAVGGVGTGTGQFPTAAQLLTTGFCNGRKSASADTVTRAWVCYADGKTCIFLCRSEGTAVWTGFIFGEFYSYYSGTTDAGRTILVGRSQENSAPTTITYGGLGHVLKGDSTGTNLKGRYCMDTAAGGGGSESVFPNSDGFGFLIPAAGGYNNGNAPSPDPFLKTRAITPLLISQLDYGIRGAFRGIFVSPNVGLADGSVITGTGAYAGRTFAVFTLVESTNILLIETSNTLDTNA